MTHQQKKSPFRTVAFILLTLLFTAVPALAQQQDEFAAKQKQAAASNPEGITFIVQVKGGQSVFHQGEVIPLELVFTSSLADVFHASTASYDRGGRLEMDAYHVDPQIGVSDPLNDYFQFTRFSFGGGLSSNFMLGKTPYIYPADLNEWQRFDRPGRYRLYVTTGRVGRGRPYTQSKPFTLTSNMIDLQIVPAEPAWAKQTLTQAISALDSNSSNADQRAACRVLRFLNTEDAVREMIKRFGRSNPNNNCQSELEFALLSTTHHAFALAEMESGLAAPQQPVTSRFLHVLTFQSFMGRNLGPRPRYDETNQALIAEWQRDRERRDNLYNEIMNGYEQQLAAGVFLKEGVARALSLETLLSSDKFAPPSKKTEEQVRAQAALVDAIVSEFADLPQQTQQNIIGSYWPVIKSPAMIPHLRRMYQDPANKHTLLPSTALARLYELSPDEGRQLILAEMLKPNPSFDIKTFTILKDETLPEVDTLVIEKLQNMEGYDEGLLLSLAERYATVSISTNLKSAYEDRIGKLDCAPQTTLLAYFLRVNPAHGAEMIEKALASRKTTRCYANLLTDMARLHMSPELERIAITSLDDPDPQLAASAIEMLGGYGSAGARDALMRRFERLRDDGSQRASKPGNSNDANPMASSSSLDTALVRALISSPAWLTDQEMLGRLHQLCVTEICLSEVDTALKQTGTTIFVYFNALDGSVRHASLAQYHFISWDQVKEKVTQFPEGTAFTFRSDSPGSPDEEHALTELKTYLEKSGMKLIR